MKYKTGTLPDTDHDKRVGWSSVSARMNLRIQYRIARVNSMEILDLDIQPFVFNLIKLLAAFIVTLPVAWDREVRSRSMGLRTFPLVAMASCGFVLVAADVIGLDDPNAQARIIQGLMTGIGFIGGGAILKDNGTVRGTATAASIWGTGVIGAAIAYGRYEIAIVVSVLIFALLRFLQPIKSYLNSNDEEHS